MVNHYWDGTSPPHTECRDDFIGPETVPHVSVQAWSLVSCPSCLETKTKPLAPPTPEEISALGALMSRSHDVQKHLFLKCAFMVPADFMPGVTYVLGHEVIRGDRFGVVIDV